MTDSQHWKEVAEGLGVFVGKYKFGKDGIINHVAVRIGDGKLMVVSPGIAVAEETFAELDALGQVTALVSPGAFHHLGLPEWIARYPEARLFSTESGCKRIPKKHERIEALEPLTKLAEIVGDDIVILECPSKRHGDLVFFVSRGGHVAMFTNELLGNMATLPKGFIGLLFKLTKSGPGLKLNGLAMKLIGAKKKPVAAFLAEQIAQHGVTAFVPCHGEVLVGDDVQGQIQAVLDAAA